jgi:hypothetical protein
MAIREEVLKVGELLLLRDWFPVAIGPARAGDRYWDLKVNAWLPVTGADYAGKNVLDLTVVVIRKKGSD